jgi:hypothetical protein
LKQSVEVVAACKKIENLIFPSTILNFHPQNYHDGLDDGHSSFPEF